MIKLRDYQATAIERVRLHVSHGRRQVLIVAPTGAGKCLAPDTPVLMHNGRIVTASRVAVGDLLMGPDSRPRAVLSTTVGEGPRYRISPVKGDPWECNDVHVLTLKNTVTGKIVDIPLDEYLQKSRTFRHEHKLFCVGVEFPYQPPLPVDPYFLGVWIGDGTKRLAGVGVTKADAEIVAAVHETAARWGSTVTVCDSGGTRCPTWKIVTPRGQSNQLLSAIRGLMQSDMGPDPKVFRGSRAERLQLLAGVVDTDGHLGHGYFEVVQKPGPLSDGIAFLARSLGFRVTHATKIVNGQPYDRWNILGNIDQIPTRIPRKQALPRRIKKDAARTGFTVEKISDAAPYAGFMLDGDGRFLLGDFTVTHNTVLAGAIMQGAVAKGSRCLFLAHRRELIEQPSRLLDSLGIDHGVIKAGHPRVVPDAPVQVASIMTLRNRQKPPADIVVIDEAHRARAKTYEEILDHYPTAVVLGLTATPWRLDARGLGKRFAEIVVVSTPRELCDQGFLVEPAHYAPTVPDMAGAKTRGGDYTDADALASIEKSVLVGDAVAHWKKLANGRRTVVFCCTVEHSKRMAEAYRAGGVAAEHLDGTMQDDERDAILGRLATGETMVLCNVDIVTEGYDLPVLSCCQILRPTKSITKYLQFVGRIMRTVDGKDDAVILDHAALWREHGFVCDARDYSIEATDHTPKKKAEPDPHVCESCLCVYAPRLRKCPMCGEERPVQAREVSEEDGELGEMRPGPPCPKCSGSTLVIGERDIEIRVSCRQCRVRAWIVDESKRGKATPEQRQGFYRTMLARAKEKGYRSGWADHMYRQRFGRWPSPQLKLKVQNDGQTDPLPDSNDR